MRSNLLSKFKHSVQSVIHGAGFHVMKYTTALIVPPHAMLAIDLDFTVAHLRQRVPDKDFFLVQVGAYDGFTNDPVHDYLVNYGWHGLLIEPQRMAFELLKKTYEQYPWLTLINAAIGEQDGPQKFYQVHSGETENNPLDWSTQIASLDRSHLLKHRKSQPAYGISTSIPDIAEKIEINEVECLTFDTLIDKYAVRRIDLLQIDAEGSDDRLVLSFPYEKLKPSIIRYEHMHLSNEQQERCLYYLMEQGYRVGFEFADTIAYLG